jgi:radical SAM/Cys-rich protein
MNKTGVSPARTWLEEDKAFEQKLAALMRFPLSRETCKVLQVNVSKKCNLACLHCHVDAGPARMEIMPKEVLNDCLRIARELDDIDTIDITGGSPETNPFLPWFIDQVAKTGKRIILRSNLVIFSEPGYRDLPQTFARKHVEIVTSISDYSGEKTDRIRGSGSFGSIIGMMGELNAMGYGIPGSGLVLNLVYNPAGAYLPAPQTSIENEYRKRLTDNYGVRFNNLYCITNMPVGRFLDFLIESGNYQEYIDELIRTFNPAVVDSLMCRYTMSVGWDGRIYDCDFNQMLGIPASGALQHISEFDPKVFNSGRIEVRNHCFGCTSGSGSSCRGSLCEQVLPSGFYLNESR